MPIRTKRGKLTSSQIRQFAQTKSGFTYQESLVLLLLMNGVGLPGRFIAAFVADRYLDALQTCIVVVIPFGIMMLCWIAVYSHESMFVKALAYGLLANCALSRLPASNAYFGAKSPEKSGTRVGMITTVNSIPLIPGPFIAGKLIEFRGGDYLYAQLFGGLRILTGSLFLIGAQWAEAEERKWPNSSWLLYVYWCLWRTM